jgi:hypothetical protein
MFYGSIIVFIQPTWPHFWWPHKQLGSPNSQRPVPNHPATLLKQRGPATNQNIKKQAKLTAKHDETMPKPGFWSFRWMFFCFFNKNQANIWEGLRFLKQSDHAVEVGRFSRSHQTTSYKPTTLSMMCSNPLWLLSLCLWNPKVFQHFSCFIGGTQEMTRTPIIPVTSRREVFVISNLSK